VNQSIIDIFNVIESFGTVQPDSGKIIELGDYPTVNQTDIEAVSLIRPSLDNGPWIAGGACLRWFQGQPVGESDIDVFCSSAKQAADVIEHIKSHGRYSIKYESENAVTLHYTSKDSFCVSWTIQIITRRFFHSLKDVIDNFDITVCQVGTAGRDWVLGSHTARDIREKNLRFKLPLQSDAPKRLTKYWTYGYRPVEGTVMAIQQNPETRWSFSSDEDYQNAF
jgi:hypothetical protein